MMLILVECVMTYRILTLNYAWALYSSQLNKRDSNNPGGIHDFIYLEVVFICTSSCGSLRKLLLYGNKFISKLGIKVSKIWTEHWRKSPSIIRKFSSNDQAWCIMSTCQ